MRNSRRSASRRNDSNSPRAPGIGSKQSGFPSMMLSEAEPCREDPVITGEPAQPWGQYFSFDNVFALQHPGKNDFGVLWRQPPIPDRLQNHLCRATQHIIGRLEERWNASPSRRGREIIQTQTNSVDVPRFRQPNCSPHDIFGLGHQNCAPVFVCRTLRVVFDSFQDEGRETDPNHSPVFRSPGLGTDRLRNRKFYLQPPI
jgi:hypothetical protein